VAGTLEARVEEPRTHEHTAAAVRLALHVTNTDDGAVELRFPNGQLCDFAVLDASGHELWRWSTGRMFTQTLQTRRLDAHEALTLAAAWAPEGRTGRFTAVATLRTSADPTQYHLDFTIP
jgi:hypothetical protein